MENENKPLANVSSEEMHKAVLQHIAEKTGRTYEEVLAAENERIAIEAEVKEKLEQRGIFLKPGETWGSKWITKKEVALILDPFYNLQSITKGAKENTLPFGSIQKGQRWYFDKEGVFAYLDKMQAAANERAEQGKKVQSVQ